MAEAAEAARVDTERRMEVRMHAQLSELEGLLGQLESAAPALVRSRAAAVVAKAAHTTRRLSLVCMSSITGVVSNPGATPSNATAGRSDACDSAIKLSTWITCRPPCTFDIIT